MQIGITHQALRAVHIHVIKLLLIPNVLSVSILKYKQEQNLYIKTIKH